MTLFDDVKAVDSKPLRPHQILAIEDTTAAAKAGHRRIMLQASVGWGKTLYSGKILLRSIQKGKRSMFTVPRNSLVDQTVDEFRDLGIEDIGVIQAQHEMTCYDARMQVASIHTAIRRQLPDMDLVIVDEAHLNTDAFNKLIDSPEWAKKLVIGLSATPWKRGMGFRWTKLISTITTRELIEQGWLVRPRYFVGSEDPDTTGLKTKVKNGEEVVDEEQEAAIMSNKVIVGDVVKTWLEHGDNRPTFLYAVNLAHARAIRDEFERAGVRCGYIDGEMGRPERLAVLKMFRDGQIKIICNYGTLTTGIDEDVRCIIIARILKNEITWVQIIGRGLRTDNPGKRVKGMPVKTDCIVIDHGCNLTREDGTALPPAEDIYHDYLDTTDPKEKKKPYEDDEKPATSRKCHKCGAVIPPKTKACPQCGDVSQSTNHGVATKDGRFHELGDTKKPAKKDEKQTWYSGFMWIAQHHNYSKGWVSHKYKEKFGVWPKGLQETPEYPASKIFDFERKSRMNYYKARNAETGFKPENPLGVPLEGN